ncbi:MAG: GGDEF domain-containing protein [Nitrospinae bacterium]|nr:GGDEF domain-containing protein [Nitrospinota bacterium]
MNDIRDAHGSDVMLRKIRRVVNVDWTEAVKSMDFAFQPIVNISTGYCVGYEALLRGYERAGFGSISEVFDTALEQGSLVRLNLMLIDSVMAKFKQSECHKRTKLFVNFDNRMLFSFEQVLEGIEASLDKHELHKHDLCVEISEKYEICPMDGARRLFSRIKSAGFKIALDDFGTGFSGMQLLYNSEPNYIKIDRFFISGINHDEKKKVFVSNLINLVHTLGAHVIAEGVETKEEFYLCKDLGCDLIQGFLVQSPSGIILDMQRHYPHIEALSKKDKRTALPDNRLVFSMLEEVAPVRLMGDKPTLARACLPEIFDTFRSNKDISFIPVVNDDYEPVGIIREKNIKDFVYNFYGMALLQKKGVNINSLISRCPVAELSSSAERILEIFSLEKEAEGLLITNNGKYIGVLGARSILRVIYEKNLQVARDQNPLTKLPGNVQVSAFMSRVAESHGATYMLVYFDFDNFKPFNDAYGFKKGDEAILLFGGLLKEIAGNDVFAGHIGGDDFFTAIRIRGDKCHTAIETVKTLVNKFSAEAISLYAAEDIANDFFTAQDREGNTRRFPLLTVSAGALVLPQERNRHNVDDISCILAELKKQAKHSADKVVVASLSANCNGIPASGPLRASSVTAFCDICLKV